VTDAKPYLGRCKEPGCDFALFATAEQVQPADDWKDVKLVGTPYRLGNSGVIARCPKRHRAFGMKRIKGTYSESHKCDSRCLNAKGHDCTCSCGGMNHGRGYAVEVVDASAPQVVQANSDEITEKQEAFIRRLLDEREIPPTLSAVIGGQELSGESRRKIALAKLDNGEFTKRQASKTIEWLLTLPKKEN
jgi:hypothetical protein